MLKGSYNRKFILFIYNSLTIQKKKKKEKRKKEEKESFIEF